MNTTKCSFAGILAEIAHQLSSTRDWEKRVEISLRVLHVALPPGTVALGLEIHGWKNFCYPEPQDREDLELVLLQHHSILMGQVESTPTARVHTDKEGRKCIKSAKASPGSFLTVPVIASDRMLGVLHARSDEECAYSTEHLSLMRAAAAQMGGYALGVLAGSMEEERLRLADELADRVSELNAILDSAPVAVWVAHDPECRSITGNAYADRILQAPRGGNISRSAPQGEAAVTYRGFRHGVELTPEEFPAQVVMATGESVIDEELDLLLPDGRWVNLVVGAVPIFDDEGCVHRAIVTGANVTPLKQAEEEVRALAQRLSSHMETSPLAVVEWDREYRVIRWSGEAERVFGWSAEEMLGKHIDDVRWVYEEDWPIVAKLMEDMNAGIRSRNVNPNRNYRKDGSVIYCEWYNSVLHDSFGNVTSILSLVLNVTERKQAEEALRESEERFRTMAENTPDAILRIDQRFQCLYVNTAAERIVGVKCGALNRRSLSRLLLPYEVKKILKAAVRDALRTGQQCETEFDYEMPEGQRHFHVRIAPEFAVDGTVQSVLLVGRDITERISAENELRESRERLTRIMATIPAAVLMLDRKGRHTFANRAAERLFGMNRSAILGQSYNDLESRFMKLDGCPLPDEELPFSRVLATGKPIYDVEYSLKRPDGKRVAVSANAAPLMDPNGRIVGVVESLADITERKRWEAEVANTREEAERRADEAEEGRRVLQALVDNVPEGIIIADAPDVNFRIVSRYAQQVSGQSGEILEGITEEQHVERWQVFEADGMTQAKAEEMPLTRATKYGEVVKNEEWVIERVDGTRIPILCNAGPIHDQEGNITGGVIAWRDISEIKAAREALQEAYERERRISEVLQQSLLPKVSLNLPNHEIHASYHSALAEADVGGDFYDVFDLVDDWKALVLGDVSGKGLRAAVYTAMAKYMLRAYAHEDPEPKSVLRRLNEALAEFMPDETFITILYGLIDTRRNIFVYANAGHEPPIVYSADTGTATTLDVTGPAVGMVPRANYSQRTMPIFPGNIILVYTDGITDARVGCSFFGVNGVSDVLIKYAHEDACDIAERIYQAALEFSKGHLSDDAALLLAKVKPTVEARLESENVESLADNA